MADQSIQTSCANLAPKELTRNDLSLLYEILNSVAPKCFELGLWLGVEEARIIDMIVKQGQSRNCTTICENLIVIRGVTKIIIVMGQRLVLRLRILCDNAITALREVTDFKKRWGEERLPYLPQWQLQSWLCNFNCFLQIWPTSLHPLTQLSKS